MGQVDSLVIFAAMQVLSYEIPKMGSQVSTIIIDG